MDGLLPAQSAVEVSASSNRAPMVRRLVVLLRCVRGKAISDAGMDVRTYTFSVDACSRARLLPGAGLPDAYRGRSCARRTMDEFAQCRSAIKCATKCLVVACKRGSHHCCLGAAGRTDWNGPVENSQCCEREFSLRNRLPGACSQRREDPRCVARPQR